MFLTLLNITEMLSFIGKDLDFLSANKAPEKTKKVEKKPVEKQPSKEVQKKTLVKDSKKEEKKNLEKSTQKTELKSKKKEETQIEGFIDHSFILTEIEEEEEWSSDEEWEVEAILDKQVEEVFIYFLGSWKQGEVSYLVKWKGWPIAYK